MIPSVSLPFCPCCQCNGDSATPKDTLVLCPSWMVSSTEQSSSTCVILIGKGGWLCFVALHPAAPAEIQSNLKKRSFKRADSSSGRRGVNLECCRTCIMWAGQVTRILGKTQAWPSSCAAPNEAGIDTKVHSSLLSRDAEILLSAILSQISTGVAQCWC